MGYKKSTITLDFPDLVDEGEECWVKIKNPKLQPADALTPRDDVDENDFKQVEAAAFEIMAGLIIDWRVWDPADDSDDPPVMPLPATVASTKRLPMEIVTRIQEEITGAIPLQPTP